ncbi:phosphoglycolate phosphatase [Rosistilla carotiformis]|uniref:Phosphoglycolate phosphatase n=1 Tax=Rosistilla carotiformis TaxID=2528017 RepID=A0A518JTE2_9BACT|nr:HAD hydrolase family protein [Rosistilla carotiformis]QDV68788.1 phosphoglycolate phosphatase [Rosistilla carotiformis]
MRLRVIATDYDGTIAIDGVLDPRVREAIGNARRRGVLVVIVSGRILSELREVAGDLDFVDGVVAENGAVIALPNGYTTLLGRSPDVALLSELTHRGIDFKVGRCVVEMDAEFADVAIELIRSLELPLAITFNRGRMMLLPAAVSKSSGLRELLNTLGVSIHNAIGIGDAENDHELLCTCEHGVAVQWGSARLREIADHVIEGDGPAAVGDYIDRISAELRLPASRISHRKLILEDSEGHAPFQIGLRGRSVLVAGDTRSGKSWLAGLLIEQMILQGYTVYVFDPEGDYNNLASLPNTVALGGGRLLPQGEDLTVLLQQGLSVVLNLSHLNHAEKTDYIHRHLAIVAAHRRERGFPHRILIDECHYYFDDSQSQTLLDTELDAYTLVTYRPSLLPKSVLQQMEVVAVTRLSEREEVDAVRRLGVEAMGDVAGDAHRWYDQLSSLGINEAALLPPTDEAEGKVRRFFVAPRLTSHVRHCTKYSDMPVAKGREFVFTDHGRPVGSSAATLQELVDVIPKVPPRILSRHCRQHDFSRWIETLFADHDLASDIRHLESTCCQNGTIDEFVDGVCKAIESRYPSRHAASNPGATFPAG